MVYNKVIHWKKDNKVVTEDKVPYEVEQLDKLIWTTWWKLVVDSLKSRRKELESKIIKQRPAWVTNEEKIQWYDFMIRVNDTIVELDNLIDIPEQLKNDYTTWNFTVDMTQ